MKKLLLVDLLMVALLFGCLSAHAEDIDSSVTAFEADQWAIYVAGVEDYIYTHFTQIAQEWGIDFDTEKLRSALLDRNGSDASRFMACAKAIWDLSKAIRMKRLEDALADLSISAEKKEQIKQTIEKLKQEH